MLDLGEATKCVLLPDVPKITRRGHRRSMRRKACRKGATLAFGVDGIIAPNSVFGSRAKNMGTSSSNTHFAATEIEVVAARTKKALVFTGSHK